MLVQKQGITQTQGDARYQKDMKVITVAPSGGADDTATLVAARNTLSSASPDPLAAGGVIVALPGNWRVKNFTLDRSNIQLLGFSNLTRFLPTADATSSDYVLKIEGPSGSGGEIQRPLVKGITISAATTAALSGNSRPQTNAVYLKNNYHLHMDDVRIEYFRGYGIRISDQTKEAYFSPTVVVHACGDPGTGKASVYMDATSSADDAPNLNRFDGKIAWPYERALHIDSAHATIYPAFNYFNNTLFHGIYSDTIPTAPYDLVYVGFAWDAYFNDCHFGKCGRDKASLNVAGQSDTKRAVRINPTGCQFIGDNQDASVNGGLNNGGTEIIFDYAERCVVGERNSFARYRTNGIKFTTNTTGKKFWISDEIDYIGPSGASSTFISKIGAPIVQGKVFGLDPSIYISGVGTFNVSQLHHGATITHANGSTAVLANLPAPIAGFRCTFVKRDSGTFEIRAANGGFTPSGSGGAYKNNTTETYVACTVSCLDGARWVLESPSGTWTNIA